MNSTRYPAPGVAWPVVGTLLVAAWLALAGDLRGSVVTPGLVALGTACAWGLSRAVARGQCGGWAVALLAVAGMLLVALLGSPTLSDDVWRYLWEGRAQRLGAATPYLLAPENPGLLDDPPGSRARVAHPQVPAVYPPAAQALLWLGAHLADAWMRGGPTAFQLLLGACQLGCAWLLWRRANTAAQRGLAAALAVHPMGLLEAGLGAHLDAAAALALLVMVLWWEDARPLGVGVAWATAALVKPVALPVLLPALLQRRAGWVLAGALGGVAAWSAAYVDAGAALFNGLGTYALHWEFNGALTPLLRWLLGGPWDALAEKQQWVLLHVDRGGVGMMQAGQWLWTVGAPTPAGAGVLVDGRLVARIAGLGVLCVWLAWAWWRLAHTPARRTLVTVLGVLLVSPTVHPWYVLPLLPLCVLAPAPALLWSSNVLVLAYAVWRTGTGAAGPSWQEPSWTAPLIWGVMLLAAGWDFHRWRSPPTPTAASPHPSSSSAGTLA